MTRPYSRKRPTASARERNPLKIDRQGILVLGMHRSGTSALTRVLALSGCTPPRTLMPAGVGNELGHWESHAIMEFNDELLDAVGTRWDDWLPINPRFPESPQWSAFVERGVEILRQEFGDAPVFALKDPRICRLAPFWFEVLEREKVAPKIVVPLRNPFEVAQSLATRDGMEEHLGLLMWLRHVLDAEVASRSMDRVFVSYDELLGDWQSVTGKINDTLGVVLPRLSPMTAVDIESFLEHGQRHHSISAVELSRRHRMAPWVAQAFAILEGWVKSGEREDDYAQLDVLTAALDHATPMFARPMLAAKQERTRRLGLELELEQLSDERNVLVSELERLTTTCESLEGERAQLADAFESAKNRLNELDDHIDQQNVESVIALDELRHRLAFSENVLRLRTEENEQLGGERDRLSEKLATAQHEYGTLQATQSDLETALASARDRITELDGELERQVANFAETGDFLEHRLAVSENTLRRRTEEIERATLEIERLSGERDSARRDHADAQADLEERFDEIARLTNLLHEIEDATQRGQGHIDWMRQVSAVTLRFPKWWGLAPENLRRQWQENRLRRRGLFDADAYRSRYPDIAGANIDPLQHYLRHGFEEGRMR
jgi:hypothetical protein